MNVGIIGLGIIGGSVAKAIKKYTDYKIWGMDINPDVIKKSIDEKTIDNQLNEDDLNICDIVIIGLYPKDVIKFLENNQKKFKKDAIVTDLSGVKEEICEVGNKLAKDNDFHFIGGHPMAGKEVWGYDNSSADLFVGASMILTPTEDCIDSEVFELTHLYNQIKFGKITISTPKQHDEMIAYTSQLAHVLSSSYVKSPASKSHSGFSAGSFKDLTRVAFLNEEMWSDIFIINKKYLINEIDILISNLNEYKKAISNCNRNELVKLLKEGSIIKRNLH